MRLPLALSATGDDTILSALAAALFASAVEMAGCVTVDLSVMRFWPARAATAVAWSSMRAEIERPVRAGVTVASPCEMRTRAERAGSATARRVAGMRGRVGVAMMGWRSDE